MEGEERMKEVKKGEKWLFSLNQRKPWGLANTKPTSYILGNCNSNELNDLSESN